MFKVNYSQDILDQYNFETGYDLLLKDLDLYINSEDYSVLFSAYELLHDNYADFEYRSFLTLFAIAKKSYLSKVYTSLTTQMIDFLQLKQFLDLLSKLDKNEVEIEGINFYSRLRNSSFEKCDVKIKDKKLLQLIISSVKSKIPQEFPGYFRKVEKENREYSVLFAGFCFELLKNTYSKSRSDNDLRFSIGQILATATYLPNEKAFDLLKKQYKSNAVNYRAYLIGRVEKLRVDASKK